MSFRRLISRFSSSSTGDKVLFCNSSRAILGSSSWNLKPVLLVANLFISLVKSKLPHFLRTSFSSKDKLSGGLSPLRNAIHVCSINRYVSSSFPVSNIGGPAAIPLTLPVYFEKNARQTSTLFFISSITDFDLTMSFLLSCTMKYWPSLRASVSV